MLYFSSKFSNVLLKKEIGCSIPCFPFCSKTPAIVFSEENVKTRNSLEKSGLMSTDACVSDLLISSKGFLVSAVYLMSTPFFNILVISLTISAKLGMKRLTKFTLPRKV